MLSSPNLLHPDAHGFAWTYLIVSHAFAWTQEWVTWRQRLGRQLTPGGRTLVPRRTRCAPPSSPKRLFGNMSIFENWTQEKVWGLWVPILAFFFFFFACIFISSNLLFPILFSSLPLCLLCSARRKSQNSPCPLPLPSTCISHYLHWRCQTTLTPPADTFWETCKCHPCNETFFIQFPPSKWDLLLLRAWNAQSPFCVAPAWVLYRATCFPHCKRWACDGPHCTLPESTPALCLAWVSIC